MEIIQSKEHKSVVEEGDVDSSRRGGPLVGGCGGMGEDRGEDSLPLLHFLND